MRSLPARRRRSSRSRCSGRGCPESASRISSSVGSGDPREQIGGRDDQARRAEPALHRARLDERLLHRVEVVAVGEPLDRRHVVAVGLRREHEARADERPVEQHRARPALALLARVLRAGVAELLAQRVEERLALPAVGLGLDAVDRAAEILIGRASSRARASSAPGSRAAGRRRCRGRRRSARPQRRRARRRCRPRRAAR